MSEDTNDEATTATTAGDTTARATDDSGADADPAAVPAPAPAPAGPKYPFLSEVWVTEARAIRQALRSDVPAATMAAVRMNQIVTDVPFGDGTIESHLDTSQGEMDLEFGHLENAEVTLTLDYDTAKAILVDGNPQVAMNAFMAGKIKVTGDVTRLIALQTWAATPDPASVAIARAIRAITE